MAFNTGNPIGSTDARDLSDNAQDFDEAVNGPSSTWVDRLGNTRTSLRGQVGYTGTGSGGAIQSYTSGLVLSGYNVIILYSGEFYRPSASATLPYTTTATLPDVDSNLVAIGDANLRQDLANDASGSGAALVSMEGGPSVEAAVLDRVIRATSVAAMETLTGLADKAQVSVAADGLVYEYDSGGDSFTRLPGRFLGNDGKLYQYISAVLRQDTPDSGFYALDDSGHTPIGISSVQSSTDGQSIQVLYNFSSVKIGAVNVTSDESFAAYPMFFGPSVGDTSLNIQVFHLWGLRTSGTASVTTGPMGAKGTDWDTVFDVPAGTITVTHGSSTHSDSAGWPVWAQLRNSDNNAQQVRVNASSRTGYTLQIYGPLAARIRNDLLVQTDAAETISAVWDGTDTLTITHPNAQSIYDAQVTSTNSRYNASVTNSSKTSTEVKLYDISTGAEYTGGSMPTSINFARASSVCKYTISGGTDTYSGRVGPVRIPVTNLAGTNTNLWLNGVFEVAQ